MTLALTEHSYRFFSTRAIPGSITWPIFPCVYKKWRACRLQHVQNILVNIKNEMDVFQLKHPSGHTARSFKLKLFSVIGWMLKDLERTWTDEPQHETMKCEMNINVFLKADFNRLFTWHFYPIKIPVQPRRPLLYYVNILSLRAWRC